MKLKNDGFCVEHILPANPADERGRRTWEYKKGDKTQISIYFRKEGEVFAGHFHKGNDPAKNPEEFVLLFGRLRALFKRRIGKESKVILDAGEPEKPNPIKLVIRPLILHEMQAETDCMYIEYRPNQFDPDNPDTYSLDEF